MNYVQFHIGDWESGTRLLKPLEKGIYIDLLMLYYSSERPLIRTNFERITRGYTAEEKEAFDYVISSFFEEREDGFHNTRCDEEIRKAAEKSEKARKSIQARWNKAAKAPRSGDANTDSSTDVIPNVSANEIRTNNERNTDVLLTNNQEPITNNQEKNIYAPDGASVSEDQKPERPSPIKKPADVSREDWADYLKLRKQKRLPLTALALQDMEREAEKAGKSMAEVVRICLKNSWAGFKASWLTKPQHGSQKQPVMEQTSFADLDYSEGINPDGTF